MTAPQLHPILSYPSLLRSYAFRLTCCSSSSATLAPCHLPPHSATSLCPPPYFESICPCRRGGAQWASQCLLAVEQRLRAVILTRGGVSSLLGRPQSPCLLLSRSVGWLPTALLPQPGTPTPHFGATAISTCWGSLLSSVTVRHMLLGLLRRQARAQTVSTCHCRRGSALQHLSKGLRSFTPFLVFA